MLRRGRPPTTRRRVVAIFLVAVMLPALFLSYIGLKSIKQEKLWQQQLVLQNLKSSLALAVDRIETSIEDQSRAFLSSLPLQNAPLSNEDVLALKAVLQEQKYVEQVFLLDRDFHPLIPRTFRSRVGPSLGTKVSFDLEKSESLKAGENLELRGELDEAIKEYKKGIAPSSPVQERLALLIRIARCEFKKHDYGSARQTYQRILSEDQNQFYREEIPYVLLAYFQLVQIAEKLDSPLSVANHLTDFYRVVLENFGRVERAQFEFYLEEVKTRLSEELRRAGTVDRSRFDKLKELEEEVSREQALGNLLQSSVIPKIQEEFSFTRASKSIRYLTVSVDGTQWHIGYQVNDENTSPFRIVGFKIATSVLMSSIWEVCSQVNVGEGIKVALIDDRDRIVESASSSPSNIVFTAPFSNVARLLPGHTVGIVSTGDNPVEAISAKSLAIYYVLIFSIIAVIILGIVFVFRDISREEELSRMKSEFISNVSHEIKTPIATVRTLAENLNEGWITDESKRRDYFHLIARESERLSHLVENILDFSRLDARRKTYRMELVPLSDVINKALERFRLLVDGQGVILEQNVPPNLPQVKVDSEAVEQALLNLLDNAVKYSREEKYVGLSAERAGNNVAIKVTDHGCGMAKGDLQRVFEKFYRVDSSDGKKIPGSGIGLTLVKEIFEAHGGRVEVESEVGKGSMFTVILPISIQ